ncbi:MAG: type IX secretion system sortase PorU [Sphingobacteriales bacterium]|nr:MAG: type IX secretion system sortase PorU [Sphingobacteriales bacterium]
MKKIALALTFFLSSYNLLFAEEKNTYRVSGDDIHNGYIVKQVWLQSYVKPNVSLSGMEYKSDVKLPDNALPGRPDQLEIILGKDRKKPFALVRIPAFYSADGKTVKQLAEFTLVVNETEVTSTASAAKTTAPENSVLATGNWFKISVPGTGLYKVDFDFLSSKLGISSPVSSSAIRVFGNGGRMLPEQNSPRVNDLAENSIWVNDGGDGSFGPGDYFVFYAIGANGWSLNKDGSAFVHSRNIYEDKSFYFLNFDGGNGKRVGSANGPSSANVTITEFNDYLLHEEEKANPAGFGKKWWGEDFGTSPGKVDNRTFEIDLKNAFSSDIAINLGSASSLGGNFSATLNSQPIGSVSFMYSSDDMPVVQNAITTSTGANGKVSIKLTYKPSASNGTGYLDYIQVNSRRPLTFTEDQLLFRSIGSVGTGKVATYRVDNAGSATQVWDITDPYNATAMNGSFDGSTFVFNQDGATLYEFAAFKGASLPVPSFESKVANQNLHGHGQVDYIIVTPTAFANEAIELASFHEKRRGLRTIVASPEQIYNEFSSGSQDISAIRDFARMFYDRAGTNVAEMPKYLLLFGDASYDYRNRVANNTNFVPTFETAESFSFISSYCNDDFFGFLDDNENIENISIAHTLDIGVGRLPIKSRNEAKDVVNKIKHYKSPASLGPWRLNNTIITDNEDDAGPHLEDGEVMDSTIIKNSSLYNSVKVYQDVIPVVSTPGGNRSPEANKAINDQVFRGTFLLNYSGHGNTQVLAEERILTLDDYSKWKNLDKMPFMVTATCDFSRFDHPDYVSAGERMVLKYDGGVISALTTTQLVYQYSNRIINREYLDAQFKKVDGHWNTFGDAYRIGKNFMYSKADTDVGNIINFRKFALLGDPALEPNFPEHNVRTDEVLDGFGNPVDSVKALGEYVIKGSVTDEQGNLLPDFNGRVSVSFFDKPRVVDATTNLAKRQILMRNNIIYRGKATATNGKFSVTFIAPKDLNYEFGPGKVSYYAENGSTDGAGSDNGVIVGGYSDYPVIENNGPIVRPYIGDSTFRSGGLTGPNTQLYVILEDATGINVSGNSVGHDLVAVLDGDVSKPYILNDYYETAPNTYKRGYVTFPLTDVTEGRHRMTVKAWDVNNNSGVGYVDFEVKNGNVVKVQNLMNYPNPFRDETHFVFEHNHPDESMNAEINIYTSGGALVKSLKQTFTAGISRSNEITWDGTSDMGAKLPSGIYIYRMRISTATGISDMGYQKLVITR